MKRIIPIIISVILITLALSSCGKSQVDVPQEEKIKAICELTTIEAYYTNLAKSTLKKDGVIDAFDKERKFWVEYEGYAKIGVDMKKVSMKTSGNTISITMPKAEILEVGLKSSSFDENSYIYANGGWFFPIKIKVEDLRDAVTEAQKVMREEVENTPYLFAQAQDKAVSLIENYINKLGEASNIKYEIVWNIQ